MFFCVPVFLMVTFIISLYLILFLLIVSTDALLRSIIKLLAFPLTTSSSLSLLISSFGQLYYFNIFFFILLNMLLPWLVDLSALNFLFLTCGYWKKNSVLNTTFFLYFSITFQFILIICFLHCQGLKYLHSILKPQFSHLFYSWSTAKWIQFLLAMILLLFLHSSFHWLKFLL